MKFYYLIGLLSIGLFALSGVNGCSLEGVQKPKTKLLISLYYETLCPDSVRFITNGLYPFWRNGGKDYIDIHLIPYGKAIYKLGADQSYSFDCQHGPNECAKNRAHACVIDVEEKNRAIDIVACAMRSTYTDLNRCIETNNGNVTAVDNCIATNGDKLLAGYGDETYKLNGISFVPTIAINNEVDYDLQNDLLFKFGCTIKEKLQNLK